MIRPPATALAVLVALVLVVSACAGDRPSFSVAEPVVAETAAEVDAEQVATSGERSGETATTVPATPSSLPTPTTLAGRPVQSTIVPSLFPDISDQLPQLPSDGVARALITPTGVVADVISTVDGGFLILTPCGREAVVSSGQVLSGAHVVIDAGHGGTEPGAVGPQGVQESHVNLAIAQRLESLLEAAGITVVQTRTDDYRISILSRTAIATSLAPQAFISIHHNAAPDGPSGRPGAETYYQAEDPESKRLAGLIFEEALASFEEIDIEWAGDTDAGVKYRKGESGADYYGILRRSAGVPATLTELLYLTNPPEEALLVTPAFQQVEAEAIGRAVVRFLTTEDPGSGFVEAYPRSAPAGGGGGTGNCEDPAFE